MPRHVKACHGIPWYTEQCTRPHSAQSRRSASVLRAFSIGGPGTCHDKHATFGAQPACLLNY
eukprot:15455295-Alexandrium_andersonii.AAC.1